VEADLGQQRLFVQIYVIIPFSSDDAPTVSITTPANDTLFDWDDDADPELDGFQVNVSGSLTGFGANVALSLSSNGLQLDATATLEEPAESFRFTSVTLLSGPQVLIVTASETIGEELVTRSAIAFVTVPALPVVDGPVVEITVPFDGQAFSWADDLDLETDDLQVSVSGALQYKAGEIVTLALLLDGIDTGLAAEISTEEALPEAPISQDEAAQNTFLFRNVTIPQGVHRLTVLATQGALTALDQISVAAPLPRPTMPSAQIGSPLDGTALSLTGGNTSLPLTVTGTFANASQLFLYVDGQPTALVPEIDGNAFTFEGLELSAGVHALQIQASDGSYQGVSAVVTIYLGDFELLIHWPAASAELYGLPSGTTPVEIIGQLQGCADCEGVPEVEVWVGEGTPEPVTLDAQRAFRHTLDIQTTGELVLTARARQTLTVAEGAGSPPTFEVTEQRSFTILAPEERPDDFDVVIMRPTNDAHLIWRDDADFALEGFQLSVMASVTGLSLGEASFELSVDGVLAKTDLSQDCALTIEAQVITAITCGGITLSEGPHSLRLTATRHQDGAVAMSNALVWAPAAEEQPSVVLVISAPADGATLSAGPTDVTGRFFGFGPGADFILMIDDAPSAALVTLGEASFAFQGVPLSSGTQSLKVLATQTDNGVPRVASDEISVTVVGPPTLSIDTLTRPQSDSTLVSGTIQDFGAEATFWLDAYVDGLLVATRPLGAADIVQGAFNVEMPDASFSPPPEADACHYLILTLVGQDGELVMTDTKSLEIGDCVGGPPKALVVTRPLASAVIAAPNADSALLTVEGSLLGYASVPTLSLGDTACTVNLQAMTFACEGSFEVGDHNLIVRDAQNDVASNTVAITVQNTTGCPIALEQATDLLFSRHTPGLTLHNGPSGVWANYTFIGTVPAECASGTVTVSKRASVEDPFVAEPKALNILPNGTFVYRARLNDGLLNAGLSFSANKPFFATAPDAQLSYTTDFTVPILVAGPPGTDTFSLGATRAQPIYFDNDIRPGLKAQAVELDSVIQAQFDMSFTARGLSTHAERPDQLTIGYSGSSTPLLSEPIYQSEEEGGDRQTFTKTVAIPEGDWTLFVTLTDATGNTSTANFLVHVDLSCGLTLDSTLKASAIVLDPDMNGPGNDPELVLSATSSCEAYSFTYDRSGLEGLCEPSDSNGQLVCHVPFDRDVPAATLSLYAPNGASHDVQVFLRSNVSPSIAITAPTLKERGFVVVSAHNTHCPNGLCAENGYVVDLDQSPDTGTFRLSLAVLVGEGYGNLACEFRLDDESLVDQPCEISETGIIDQHLHLDQKTQGVLTIHVNSTHPQEGMASASTSIAVTIASLSPETPSFLLPPDNIVKDCTPGQSVTCVKDRHQGVLDVWLEAPSAGLQRQRGFVTGTTVASASNNPGNNTQLFNAAAFADAELMTYFSALPSEDDLEHQRLQATPMNLLHLGAQDRDIYGNLSGVAIVKSIDLFWNSLRRTFTEENTASNLGIDATSMQFGRLAGVGDINGDGIDDLIVAAPSKSPDNGFIAIYYGQRNSELFLENPEIIKGTAPFGTSLTVVDVNHDGYDDIVIVYYESFSHYAYIQLGGALGLTENKFIIKPQYEHYDILAGFLNVSVIGDINGDGYSDLAFSESHELIGLAVPVTADVFIVPTGAALMDELSSEADTTLADIALFKIERSEDEALGESYGLSSKNILTVPDSSGTNGLLIGEPRTKKVYYFRATTLSSECSEACLAMDAADQTFSFDAEHSDQEFGHALAVLDQNNDGLSDLFFGMPSQLSGSQSPQNYVLSALGTEDAEGLSFTEPVQFHEEVMTKGYFGTNLRSGSLFGDGLDALVVGGSSTVDDRVHIFWNSASTGLSPRYGSIIEGTSTFGQTIEMGDFNGDGQLDLFIAAPLPSPQSTGDKNGEFHVYY
ncbi:MAG: VCBS repeat-containing protein, partial [Myxococcales bacterium]|nr:VCBS repeat-containing protein [Myxococcales bacterium]